jgi:hypothetical protein
MRGSKDYMRKEEGKVTCERRPGYLGDISQSPIFQASPISQVTCSPLESLNDWEIGDWEMRQQVKGSWEMRQQVKGKA